LSTAVCKQYVKIYRETDKLIAARTNRLRKIRHLES